MNKNLLQYIRHLSKEDKKTLSQKVLKIFEEGGDLAKIALPFDGAYATNHRFVEREKLLEEAVDTVLTAISVAYHLDFTDDEIEEMFVRKTEKWAWLQHKESDLKYPIPFEIHVTVVPETRRSLDMFKAACAEAQVKPIVLDLDNNSTYIQTDVMTSSKHFGTNASAYRELEHICGVLIKWGFDIVRRKIETIPWHPAAPRDSKKDSMPANCYFEAHIPVELLINNRGVITDALIHDGDVHISKNAFKKSQDGKETVMVTYRSYTDTLGQFEQKVDRIVHHLSLSQSLTVGKPMKEFSIYDTKVSHDARWLNAN